VGYRYQHSVAILADLPLNLAQCFLPWGSPPQGTPISFQGGTSPYVLYNMESLIK